ncbi:uncharacterized protein ACHE_50817A [Aspergillus chevalieri]|uniref:Uncharacterized protein n=1 Tax=Aspergillus chevalieri TaxID=182096 RepID=A0A7R7VT40_ASPCH|nr:uncharacterized protein ACHE_50817A [Aspergillus chevalieri]BCR89619.1 hypothetical protein ACHE_50817A [Aspergillus chevalieri]
MHYPFVLISTLTTIAFAAPAPPNLRSTHTTTTTTTTTTATLNKPTTHIGTPQIAHVPITIPDQRPPHQVNPNLRPVYTPIARPGPGIEPGRNPLFARSQREDKVKRDDPRDPAIVAVLSSIAEGVKKQQQQQQHTRRAEQLSDPPVHDTARPAHSITWINDPMEIIGRRAVDSEVYDSENALDAPDYPLQRKEQRALDEEGDSIVPEGNGWTLLQQRGLDVPDYSLQWQDQHTLESDEGRDSLVPEGNGWTLLQQRGLVQRDDVDDKDEEEYNTANVIADVQRRGYVRRNDGDDEEIRTVGVMRDVMQNAQ